MNIQRNAVQAMKKNKKTGCSPHWMIISLLAIMGILAVACDDESHVSYVSPDGDKEDGIDYQFIPCGGGSVDGNPARTVVGFSVVDSRQADDRLVIWNDVHLQLEELFLADAESCDMLHGELLRADRGIASINLMSEVPFVMEIQAPGDRPFCALDWRLPANAAVMTLKGELSGRIPIEVETALGGMLPSVPPRETLQWQPGEERHWAAVLDLGMLLSDNRWSQLALTDDVLKVDDTHNAEILPELNASLIEAFRVVRDRDTDGRANVTELTDDNTELAGSPERAGYDEIPCDDTCHDSADLCTQWLAEACPDTYILDVTWPLCYRDKLLDCRTPADSTCCPGLGLDIDQVGVCEGTDTEQCKGETDGDLSPSDGDMDDNDTDSSALSCEELPALQCGWQARGRIEEIDSSKVGLLDAYSLQVARDSQIILSFTTPERVRFIVEHHECDDSHILNTSTVGNAETYAFEAIASTQYQLVVSLLSAERPEWPLEYEFSIVCDESE